MVAAWVAVLGLEKRAEKYDWRGWRLPTQGKTIVGTPPDPLVEKQAALLVVKAGK